MMLKNLLNTILNILINTTVLGIFFSNTENTFALIGLIIGTDISCSSSTFTSISTPG